VSRFHEAGGLSCAAAQQKPTTPTSSQGSSSPAGRSRRTPSPPAAARPTSSGGPPASAMASNPSACARANDASVGSSRGLIRAMFLYRNIATSYRLNNAPENGSGRGPVQSVQRPPQSAFDCRYRPLAARAPPPMAAGNHANELATLSFFMKRSSSRSGYFQNARVVREPTGSCGGHKL